MVLERAELVLGYRLDCVTLVQDLSGLSHLGLEASNVSWSCSRSHVQRCRIDSPRTTSPPFRRDDHILGIVLDTYPFLRHFVVL